MVKLEACRYTYLTLQECKVNLYLLPKSILTENVYCHNATLTNYFE